jgi:hypothetical protein
MGLPGRRTVVCGYQSATDPWALMVADADGSDPRQLSTPTTPPTPRDLAGKSRSSSTASSEWFSAIWERLAC